MTKIYHELHPDNIAILRNPTAEGAMRQLKKQLGFEPSSPRVTLAAVHKARLLWSGSTSEMIEESKRWLVDNGFSPTLSPYVEM